MKEEKISVIVPAYNIESYIENTVKSICAQTYSDLEIILVDDGSTDGTPQIIDRLAKEDARIVVFHKTNGGVTSARLWGVEKATGKWIGFVDGDDYIEPHMYEILLKNALEHDADISHCGYQMLRKGEVKKFYGTGKKVKQSKCDGMKSLFLGTFFDPGLWNKLYNIKLFDGLLKEDLMDTSIKNNEDMLMNYYLFRETEASVFEDLCLYHYQVRENSATQKKLNVNQLLDPLKVTRIIRDEVSEDEELLKAIMPRHIQLLVGLSTRKLEDDTEFVRPYQETALIELRTHLKRIIMMKQCRFRLKIVSIWVAICPWSYKFVRELSEKIRQKS